MARSTKMAASPPRRKRGRPPHDLPSELYAARRDEILAAARKVFAKRGYQSGSLDDVAAEAGISKPTLYYYFPSKAHLFFEIASLQADAQLVALAHIAREPDPQTCLIALMRHQVQQVTKEMDFYRYFFDHRPMLKDPELRAALRQKLAAYSEYFYHGIRRAIAAGILPPVDEFIATQAIFGSTFWIYKWYDSKRYTPEEILRQFLRMIGVTVASDDAVGAMA